MRFAKPLVVSVLGLAFASAAIAGADDVVKYRQNNMKAIGGHTQSIVAIVKGEVPFDNQLEAHARALAATTPLTKDAFKEQAQNSESNSKSEIWSNWDDFAKKSDAMHAAAEKLVAAGSDKRALRAAVGELGKTCKSCHDDYKN